MQQHTNMQKAKVIKIVNMFALDEMIAYEELGRKSHLIDIEAHMKAIEIINQKYSDCDLIDVSTLKNIIDYDTAGNLNSWVKYGKMPYMSKMTESAVMHIMEKFSNEYFADIFKEWPRKSIYDQDVFKDIFQNVVWDF